MLDVIERKWRSFARERYAVRVLKFVAMFGAVFGAAVAEPGSPASTAAVAAVLVTWAANLQQEVARLQPRRTEEAAWRSSPQAHRARGGGAGPIALLDLAHLTVRQAVERSGLCLQPGSSPCGHPPPNRGARLHSTQP